MPTYGDRIVFVNAITDDASAQRLASTFSFQYIPTSYFVTRDGAVSQPFTGPLTEAQMRAQLDRLVAE